MVLVVEDDQLIQAMVEEALSDGGFASALTASGEEAITLLQDDKSKYRAVVTDINLLGKLDGWEVGRAAREIDPTMPIIYMTGTHGEEWASKGVPNSVYACKAFRACAACDRHLQSTQYGNPASHADSVRPLRLSARRNLWPAQCRAR